MSNTSIVFLLVFVAICVATLITPLAGVVGYVLHYHMAPELQWWGQQVSAYVRLSATLAVVTIISILVHFRSLRPGKSWLTGHEKLTLLFLGLIWLSVVVGLPHEKAPGEVTTEADPPQVKMAKVILFAMVITHLVTTTKALKVLLWTMVIGGLYLGVRSYTADPAKFVTGGRLEFIGGPDFHNSNALAGHFALLVPIIAVLFVRSRLLGKAICLAAGAFVVNGLILTRSRGAFLALAGGMVVAVLLAPKGYRKTVLIGLVVVAAGFLRLADPNFRERASTIAAPSEQRDISAQSRLDIWAGSLTMLAKHPFGVGVGNFPAQITKILPRYPGRDAHNTYVLCYGELGIQGIIVLVIVIVSAVKVLWAVQTNAQRAPPAHRDDLIWLSYALGISLVIVLVRGMTMSRLYTESTWWVLSLPVCLLRAQQNIAAAEPLTAAGPAGESKSRRPRFGPRRRQPVALGKRT